MAFRGQYEHSLDAKDRLTIPSKFRAQLAGGVVVSLSLDDCLEIWPAEAFAAYASRVESGLNPLSAKARLIRRHIHSHSDDSELDSAGRVRVPKPLKDLAGLDGACMVVGTDTHLEVWHPDRWMTLAQDMKAQVVAAAEELAGADWPA